MNLLTLGNAKTPKGERRGYLTGILYLAPYTVAGIGNVCPWSTPGCRVDCLFHQGRARVFGAVNVARIRRTVLFMRERARFAGLLEADIAAVARMARRRGMRAAVRLNGTSDIRWHAVFPEMMPGHPGIRFYDYTKDIEKMRAFLAGKLPANYYVTFSLAETAESREHARETLKRGGNVAAVFRQTLPKRFMGAKVINGDEDDLRFLDPRGVIVGLRAKGSARQNRTGFVIDEERQVRL